MPWIWVLLDEWQPFFQLVNTFESRKNESRNVIELDRQFVDKWNALVDELDKMHLEIQGKIDANR